MGILIDIYFLIGILLPMRANLDGTVDKRCGVTPWNFKDLKGQRFGRLVVLKRGKNLNAVAAWVCACDCGNETSVRSTSLIKGETQSCGCFHREKTGDTSRTHGMTGTAEYRCWRHIQNRCYNPNVERYPHYGGRGIRVSDDWREAFENFFRDMGPRPSSKHSIHRLKNDKHYCKENCIWATTRQQVLEKQNTVRVTFRGKTKTLIEWSEQLGLKYKELHRRIHARKWPIKRAFTTPIRVTSIPRSPQE